MTDAPVKLRDEGNGKLVLRGYPSVSERWYPVGRMFQEKVIRGTWKRCLGEGPDTVLLEDHSGLGLARTRTPSGEPSLLLTETERGLYCEAFLDATAPRVQDLRSTAENCGLQMSVGFRCTADSWNEDRSRREIKEASVHKGDVTVCNFGANDAAVATISARGEVGEKERRAYADSVKGAMERRMAPTEFEPVRGRSQILVPRSCVEEMKLRRRRVSRRAAVLPPPDRPRKYSYEQIQELGKKGEAFKKKNGTYSFPIVDKEDVRHAIMAIGRAPDDERLAVKRWILMSAERVHAKGIVPDEWIEEISAASPHGLPR